MEQIKREKVNFQFQDLNWNFIKLLAEIATHASEKYGSVDQYTNGRLENEKSPVNHIVEHLRSYVSGEEHDHFKDRKYHLAAIAYNAMMEFYYLENGGQTCSNKFYISKEYQKRLAETV